MESQLKCEELVDEKKEYNKFNKMTIKSLGEKTDLKVVLFVIKTN